MNSSKEAPALHIEWWPTSRPAPYAGNPRVIPDEAIAKVATSLGAYGWRQPIVVDAQGVIIAGHTRLLAARRLGIELVPVHVAADLGAAEAAGYRLMDNRSGEESGWDDALLVDELDALLDLDFDLALAGFELDLPETGGVGDPLGLRGHGADDADLVPALPLGPIARRGDLWRLGEHRLLCADCLNPESLPRLLGDERAAMVFTDPPWNVAIGGDTNPKHRQREGIANDDLPEEDFAAFLVCTAALLAARCAGDIYVVMAGAEWPAIDTALRGAQFHRSATIAWVKDTFVLGRSKYHHRWEPIWYGWPEAGRSSYAAGRDQDDVWEYPRPRASEEHPTMKPVPLVRRAIESSSRPGELILDPFLGSGTTILAAEQAGRIAAAVELESGYVDVAIARWQALTQREATLDEDGRTWDELGAERRAG